MTTSMRIRRAGFGMLVAAFSVGVVATGTSGTSLAGAPTAAHVATASHVWGN